MIDVGDVQKEQDKQAMEFNPVGSIPPWFLPGLQAPVLSSGLASLEDGLQPII